MPLLGAVHVPFPAAALRAELLALQRPGADELARAARAANALADAYADAIAEVLAAPRSWPRDVVAAGVHGQTLRHRPDEGWTLQLNNPARVAERAGVTVVADFRSRDVAAGGQGAPLVPAFHAALFGGDVHRVVVNIGGIANLTDLPARRDAVRGFDTGPGNVLLDLWHARHRGGAFDRDGAWARRDASTRRCSRTLLAEPYFARTAAEEHRPRSLPCRTGSTRSSPAADVAPDDVQATLRRADGADHRRCGVARIARRGGSAGLRRRREERGADGGARASRSRRAP